MQRQKLIIGADHAGFALKEKIKKHLSKKRMDFEKVNSIFESLRKQREISKNFLPFQLSTIMATFGRFDF